jgi:chromobox protein 1
VLDEYFKGLGGRPEKPEPKKRKSMGRPPKSTPEKPEPRKRRKSRADTETDATEDKEKEKDSQVPDWVPKSKNWENEVKAVDTIVRERDGLVAFLHWNNDKKSKVSIEMCYEKCPRKVSVIHASFDRC